MRRTITALGLALCAAVALYGCDTADAQTGPVTSAASRGATVVTRSFVCKPTVSSVSASSGTEVGGTSVTVTGTCFIGTTSVTFGGVAGTSVSVAGPTSLTVTTPAYASALSSTAADNDVTVAVVNPAGTGSKAAGFRYTSEFARIFGGLLSKEHRANDPRIALNGGNVSSWPDYAGNGAAAQGTASKQPAFNATGWNGGPCVTSDGTDDYLSATLSTTIPNGNRPYVLIAARRVAGTSLTAVFALRNSGLANYLAFRTYESGFFTGAQFSSTQTNNAINAGATNTNRHLFETGFISTGTNAVVVDGSGVNSTVTSAVGGGAMDTLVVGAWASGAQFANADIVAVIVLNNEPTSQNLTDARAAFKDSNWRGGYTGNSLGLP